MTEIWSGAVTAVSLYAGDVKISIFGTLSGLGYLTHEDLRPLACLHKDSPERDEAIKRIVTYCQTLQKEHT